MSLEGKRVIITGGSTGSGLATAQEIVRLGGQVVIAGRNPDKLAAAIAKLGKQAQSYQLDVTKEIEVKAFFEKIGSFDHLVTAAGPEAADKPLLELETAAAHYIFDTKYWGQYYATKYAAPKIQKDGSIVLFSAWLSRKPTPGLSTFAAVDGAIEALARVLAHELAPVRVNVVAPGVIDTPLWHPLPEEQRKAVLASFAAALPVKRVGQGEDIAKAVLFLLENSFATGSVVDVDGGIK